MDNPKLSLKLLKSLMSSLETLVDEAEKGREGLDLEQDKDSFNMFVVNMGKVSGVLTYLAKEASALDKDVEKVIAYSLIPSKKSSETEDLFSLAGLVSSANKSNRN